MKRKKRGFTLVEVITTVLILAAILAVGIPSILAINRRTKQMELDDTARQIFLAAQNQLTAKANAGMMPTLLPDVPTDTMTLKVVGAGGEEVYWVRDGGDTAKELISEGMLTTDTTGERFALALDKKSGSVLEAYFFQNGKPALGGGIESLTAIYGPGQKENRFADCVGFYGGDAAELAPGGGGEEIPKVNPNDKMVELLNGYVNNAGTYHDVLLLRVNLPMASNYTTTVIMEQLDDAGNVAEVGGHPISIELDVESNGTKMDSTVDPSSGVVKTLVLDQLVDRGGVMHSLFDLKFCREKYKADNGIEYRRAPHEQFTPGANIRVTATITPNPGSSTLDREYVGWEVANTFFASRKAGTSKTINGKPQNTTEITINNLRNLQNLNKEISNFDTSANNFYVAQTNDIDLSGHVWKSIDASEGWLLGYDGNGMEIQDMNSLTNGLFDAIKQTDADRPMEFKNINLVNPLLINSVSDSGYLAGKVTGLPRGGSEGTEPDKKGILIENCGVYIRKSGSYNEADFRMQVQKHGAGAGGLIGDAELAKVKGCYASTGGINGTAWPTVGGLIGVARGCSISDSYASFGYLNSSAGASGFVGQADGSTVIDHCYAAGYIASSVKLCSGFVGVLGDHYSGTYINNNDSFPEVRNSYCVMEYYRPPLDGFGRIKRIEGERSNCYFWTNKTPDATVGENAESLSYNEMVHLAASGLLSADSWKTLTTAQTYPSQQRKGLSYPFPGIYISDTNKLMPHRGYWPLEDTMNIFPAKIANNSLNVLLVPKDGTKTYYIQGGADRITIAKDPSSILTSVDVGNKSGGWRTLKLVGGSAPGMTYIDFNNNGSKTRVYVIVYDLNLSMTLKCEGDMSNQTVTNDLKTEQTNLIIRGPAKDSDPKTETGEKLTGSYSITLAPSAEELRSQLGGIQPTEGTASLNLTSFDYEVADRWNKLDKGKIQMEYSLDGMLSEVGTNKWKVEKYANGSYKLGTVSMFCAWAMDPTVKVGCDVTRENAGVQIEGAALAENQPDVLTSDLTASPENIVITALPDTMVKVDLEAGINIAPQEGYDYEWSVNDTVKGASITPGESKNKAQLVVKSAMENGAAYEMKVHVEYKNGDPEDHLAAPKDFNVKVITTDVMVDMTKVGQIKEKDGVLTLNIHKYMGELHEVLNRGTLYLVLDGDTEIEITGKHYIKIKDGKFELTDTSSWVDAVILINKTEKNGEPYYTIQWKASSHGQEITFKLKAGMEEQAEQTIRMEML